MRPSVLSATRLVVLLVLVGAGVVIFTNAAGTVGRYVVGAALVLVLGLWIHEEHSTERNATRAAAMLPPPGARSAPPPMPDLGAIMGSLGVVVEAPPMPPNGPQPVDVPSAPPESP